MEKLDVQIQPKLKKIALYTLIFMALLHGYRYVSLGFSHDSLAFAWQPDLEWQISLGRYMQPFYWWIIRGRIAAPFIVGVLSYGYMVGSVYGVASLLDLKAKTSLFLLAGLMCGSLAFIALDATYSHTADVYMLALMLNIAAAWLCLRGRRRVPSVLAAVVLLVISTGLYQAYLQVFTALTMVWALLRLLKTDDRAIPEAVARCAQSFLALMLAMALFFVGYYVVMAVTGVEAVSKANSIGGMKVLSGAALVDMVKTTWKMPLRQLGRLQGRIAPLARMLTAVVLMTGAAATIFTARRSRVSAWQALGMAVLALLLPFGMNWICLFCGGVVHDLMMYAYIVPLLAALAANERAWNLALADEGKQIGKKTRAAACVLPLAVLTLLFDRGIYANQIYLKKDLEYDTTLSVMTRVVDRIEQVEGYIPGETPVEFLGDIQRSQLAMTRPAFAHLGSLTGTEENYAITYGDTFWMYLEDVMGYPIKRFRETKNEEQERVTDDMPCFPDKDSVQMVDGVVFVKLAAQ